MDRLRQLLREQQAMMMMLIELCKGGGLDVSTTKLIKKYLNKEKMNELN